MTTLELVATLGIGGLLGSLLTTWLQGRAAHRHQLLELAIRIGLEDWKVRVEEARTQAAETRRGVNLPRADDWAVYFLAIFEALESGITRGRFVPWLWFTRRRWWRRLWRSDVMERVEKAIAKHDEFYRRFGAGSTSQHNLTTTGPDQEESA